MGKLVDMTIAVDQYIADYINTQPVTKGVNVTFAGRELAQWQIVTANGKTLYFMGSVVEGQKRDSSGGNGIFTYVMDIGTLSNPKFKLGNKPVTYLEIAKFIFEWAVMQGVLELQKAKEADSRAIAEAAAARFTATCGNFGATFQGGCSTDIEGNVTPAVWVRMHEALSIEQVEAIMKIVKG